MINEKSIDFIDSFVSNTGNNSNFVKSNSNSNVMNLKLHNTLLNSKKSRHGENEDDFSIVSSSLSEMSINEQGNLGFWNNIKKNLSDLKNKIKFNIIPTELPIDFTEMEEVVHLYDQIFDDCNEDIKSEKMKHFIKNHIFWMSYRSNFDPIVYNKTIYTSDAGWGCMIRAGQMMFAKGLYEIGKRKEKLRDEYLNELNLLFRNIILLFGDNPLKGASLSGNKYFKFQTGSSSKKNQLKNSVNVKNLKQSLNSDEYEYIPKETTQSPTKTLVTPPFSIRNILNSHSSINLNKGAGDWFSDHEIIKILQDLNDKHQPINGMKTLHINQGAVYIEDILEQCFTLKTCDCKEIRISYNYDKANDYGCINLNRSNDTENDYVVIDTVTNEDTCQCFHNCFNFNKLNYEMSNPFMLFISVRLGLEKLEESYYDSILNFFNIHNNIGLIGGKGTRALYFLGQSDRKLIFLDPHFVQESAKSYDEMNNLTTLDTYKPKDFYYLNLERMTPCITMGFYCADVDDFITLLNDWQRYLNDEKMSDTPIFSVKDFRKSKSVSNANTKIISKYFANNYK